MAKNRRKSNLKKYEGGGKYTTYGWRVRPDHITSMAEIAKENGTNASTLVRYILDSFLDLYAESPEAIDFGIFSENKKPPE